MINQKNENPLLKYHGKFGKIQSKIKEYPIIGFDTEDDSKGTPTLFAFYGDFPNKKYVTRHWQDALDFIYSIEEPTIFVCHNLEYDIANLMKQDDYLMVDEMLYASTLLRVSLYGTEHYFINSYCFFRGPLKALGKFVGLPKLEGSAFGEKYIIRDAQIPYKFIKDFQYKLVHEIGVNLGITIGQMAMQTYRRDHMISDIQITYNSPNCLKAYYGGRVEIFNKGNTHDIRVSDINSSYPNVMYSFDYPDTSCIEPSSIETHEFGIGRFKMYVPEDTYLPVLPYKSESGRLFFPTGMFTNWWTYAEVRHAVEHGAKIIKEYEGEGTNNSCRPFESYIEKYYMLKEQTGKLLKIEPDHPQAKFDYLLWKLWQNNLYGKWCQWRPGNIMTRDKWSDWKLKKYREMPDFKESKIGPFYNYSIPKVEPPKTANFMWGVYVTSYARIFLHTAMDKIYKAGGNLVYCDTDSIMYSGDIKNPLPISSKLGDWDEERFDLGVFRQAKGYLLCDLRLKNKKECPHFKYRYMYGGKKGGVYPWCSLKTGFKMEHFICRKKSEPDCQEYQIKKVASKGVPTHLAYDFLVEGMATVQKPLRMKEALIRMNAETNADNKELLEEIGENVWFETTKEMKSLYIKRVGESKTFPVSVSDISDLEKNSIMENYESIEMELRKNGIVIQKPNHKNLFENTVIPIGYFDTERDKQDTANIFVSQKIFILRQEHCTELKKNDQWFMGDVVQQKKRKGKWVYNILIESFKGKKTPVNFWAQIYKGFVSSFGITENLVGKKVEFILARDYIENRSPSFRLNISESDLKGQFEEEVIESEEMTDNELEKLMALDWNKLLCLKN